MASEPVRFQELVQESLRRHVKAVNQCVEKKGTYFWGKPTQYIFHCQLEQV